MRVRQDKKRVRGLFLFSWDRCESIRQSPLWDKYAKTTISDNSPHGGFSKNKKILVSVGSSRSGGLGAQQRDLSRPAGRRSGYGERASGFTRKAGLSDQQYLVLKEKINLELSNAKRKKLGLPATSKEVVQIRQDWERIANSHLERAGRSERIDHRSYKEQGNGKQAQIHETPQVTAMRRKGKQTEISRANDERKAYNAQLEREQQQEKENRQTALLNNAQNSLQARLAEREAQRAVEQARRAEQERKAQEQAKQERQQKHGKGITRPRRNQRAEKLPRSVRPQDREQERIGATENHPMRRETVRQSERQAMRIYRKKRQ